MSKLTDRKFGDVAGGHYTAFESDGTRVAHGDATTWNDWMLPGIGLSGAGATAPDPIVLFGAGNIRGYGFDGGSTVEQIYGVFECLHDWAEGTTVYPHIHWTPTSTSAGNVVWQFEYSLLSPGGTPSTPTTMATAATAAGGTAWAHKMTNFLNAGQDTGIDMTGRTIGTQIAFRLFRDPTDSGDTYAGDAALLTIGIHYQANTDGSRQITAK